MSGATPSASTAAAVTATPLDGVQRRRIVASTPAPLSSPYGGSTATITTAAAVGTPTHTPPATLRRSHPAATATTSSLEAATTKPGSKPSSTSASVAGTARSSLGGPSRSMASSRSPALMATQPTPHASQIGHHSSSSNDGGGERSRRRSMSQRSPLKGRLLARAYKPAPLTTTRIGALIVSNTPSTVSPVRSPRAPHALRLSPAPHGGVDRSAGARHGSRAMPLPTSLSTAEPCALYDLHHALQHRLVEELGWSLHWYLDTETEIKQLELAKELDEKGKLSSRKAKEKKPAAPAAGTAGDCGRTGAGGPTADLHGESAVADAPADGASPSTSPRYSDPNTPLQQQHHHRLDMSGRELPFSAQKSQFGVVTHRFDCSICHELSAIVRPAGAPTTRSRLNRSPLEYRLASLQRWLRKRGAESASDALLASCLSLEAQRYMAYLGVSDCWTSLFVTAGLPVVASAAATTARTPSPCPTPPPPLPLLYPATLAEAASRSDRVPLSFYVLPALCRWRCVAPLRRDRLLRESTAHPFPLSRLYTPGERRAIPLPTPRDPLLAGAAATPPPPLPPLTFFTIQQRSHLLERRRSSTRRNQMASLGESCVCDVFLVAAAGKGLGDGVAVGSSGGGGAVASVWGYVRKERSRSRTPSLPSTPSRAAHKRHSLPSGSDTVTAATAVGADHAPAAPSGELFYIASSLENYLRLGLVFGWVYGWQMCFSSGGPPPNSVIWLRLVNTSAYEAALVASRDTNP
ncbi:hypothetical protein NESM_000764600 [Novymonas esmeraldas]|uniref:Uncharacterized protein n=1 Tax=Novymonas esmeraldas TaxID=1808958 RepID=A0AAW0EV06_9TRYP